MNTYCVTLANGFYNTRVTIIAATATEAKEKAREGRRHFRAFKARLIKRGVACA